VVVNVNFIVILLIATLPPQPHSTSRCKWFTLSLCHLAV